MLVYGGLIKLIVDYWQALDLFNGISQRNFFYKKKQVFDWLNHVEGLAVSEAKEVLGSVL